MEKNQAGKWVVFAYGDPDHATLAGKPIIGDAANITANIRIDGGAANAVDDTNPAELEDGYYIFDTTAAESNGDNLLLAPASSTANVLVIGVPGSVWTRPANFNDLSITATTGQTSADMISISGDSTAADNLELQYDGTGLLGDIYPASQAQVGNLATGSAAISVVSESDLVTTGTEVNTYAVTDEVDGVYHEVTDVAGAMELYYQFDVGGNGVASTCQFTGRLTSANDTIGVYAYNWGGASWDQIGSLAGTGGTADGVEIFNLLTRHTGTGVNLGKVRVRGYAAAGLTTATLYIDQSIVSYAVVAQSVGYANGAIWMNTVNGVAGTEAYVNGVADNKVLTLANAISINSALNLDKFNVSPDSSITFAEAHTDEIWEGDGWTLALGGQDISNTHITHCNDVSGTGTTPTGECHILGSHLGALTLGECHITSGSFKSTFTAGAAGAYTIENAQSGVAGDGVPTLTYSGLGAATTINARGWMGGCTWVFDANCTASIEVLLGGSHTITTGGGDIEFRGAPKSLSLTTSGTGTTNIILWSGAPITITGTGGTVNIYGMHGGITDTSAGTTVTNNGTDITKVNDILVDSDSLVTTLGTAGAGLTDLGGMSITMKAEVLTEVVKVLTTQMTEAYAADGVAPTPAQSLMLIQQVLTDFAIAGTVITVKELDGTTTAATLTLDSSTVPTSSTRAT